MRRISIILILILLIINISLLVENINLRNEASITSNVNNVINGISSDFTDVIKDVRDGVVSIETDHSLGSGFIYSAKQKEALILTNYHVIENSSYINCYLANGISFMADVVGYDAIYDVALLKIDCEYDLKTLSFGDSEKLKAGEFVFKLGLNKSLDFDNSVAFGMISSKTRNLKFTIDQKEHYLNLIQSDVDLVEGNSGGPLINMIGEVIGLNVISQDGLTLSVPSNELSYITRDLMDDGKISRLDLDIAGLAIESMDNYQKSDCGLMLDDQDGLYVKDVIKDSLSDKLGIKSGDIIYKINGTKIGSYKDYIMLSYNVKGNYVIDVLRDGDMISIEGEND